MIQERAQYYVFPFLNPNSVVGLTQFGSIQRIDSDAPFRCFGVAVAVYNGTSGEGSIALRFSRPDGRTIQKVMSPANALVPFDTGNAIGAAGGVGPNFLYYAPLVPNVLYPPSTTIVIDIQNLPANSDTVCLVIFVGTKLFAPGAAWKADLPEKYSTLPFLSYPLQINAAQLPIQNLTFKIESDAGFIWQTGQHTSVGIPSSTHIGLIIRDWMQKPYMSDYVPVELLFGFNNAQLPGFPYPEIYIPRQQYLIVDAKVIA